MASVEDGELLPSPGSEDPDPVPAADIDVPEEKTIEVGIKDQEEEMEDVAKSQTLPIANIDLVSAPAWIKHEFEEMIVSFTRRVRSELSSFSSSSSSSRPQPFTAHSGKLSYYMSHVLDRSSLPSSTQSRCRYRVLNEVPLPMLLRMKSLMGSCFNCGDSGHPVRSCPQPFDQIIVRCNSRVFRAQAQAQANVSSNASNAAATDGRYYAATAPTRAREEDASAARQESDDRGHKRTRYEERERSYSGYERRDRDGHENRDRDRDRDRVRDERSYSGYERRDRDGHDNSDRDRDRDRDERSYSGYERRDRDRDNRSSYQVSSSVDSVL